MKLLTSRCFRCSWDCPCFGADCWWAMPASCDAGGRLQRPPSRCWRLEHCGGCWLHRRPLIPHHWPNHRPAGSCRCCASDGSAPATGCGARSRRRKPAVGCAAAADPPGGADVAASDGVPGGAPSGDAGPGRWSRWGIRCCCCYCTGGADAAADAVATGGDGGAGGSATTAGRAGGASGRDPGRIVAAAVAADAPPPPVDQGGAFRRRNPDEFAGDELAIGRWATGAWTDVPSYRRWSRASLAPQSVALEEGLGGAGTIGAGTGGGEKILMRWANGKWSDTY